MFLMFMASVIISLGLSENTFFSVGAILMTVASTIFTSSLDKAVFTTAVTSAAPSGLTFVITDSYLYSSDRVTISNSKTEYDAYRAYEITANGRTYVQFPVENEFTVVYHVINDIPVMMKGRHFVDDSGQMYLETELTSYSVYYLTETIPESPNQSKVGLVCAIMVFVILIGAYVVMMRRTPSE